MWRLKFLLWNARLCALMAGVNLGHILWGSADMFHYIFFPLMLLCAWTNARAYKRMLDALIAQLSQLLNDLEEHKE